MTSSAVPPARAPLTRRQIREAERAREAAQAVGEVDSAHQPEPAGTARKMAAVHEGPVALSPDMATAARTLGTAPRPADASSQHARVADAAPTRRQLRDAGRRTTRATRRADRRAADRRSAPAANGREARSWAPRAAVLGALGALTIAAPITGFASHEQAAPAAARTTSQVATETSLLDTLTTATPATDGQPAASLMAAPAAADRAVVRTSRSSERADNTCAPVDGARGTRAALREVGMVMPIEDGSYSLSSGYGFRSDPFSGQHIRHLGSDFSAPMGTPIHAVSDGKVVHAGLGKDGRSSMLVIIEHEVDGAHFYSWYVHMYPDGVYVTEGQQIRAGDVIGAVGSNGRSTGPHLHLEIHLDDEGTTTDALAWLRDHDARPVSCE